VLIARTDIVRLLLIDGARSNKVVISKYPNILAPRHFKTVNDIRIGSEVLFISVINQRKPFLSKGRDYIWRVIWRRIVRDDQLEVGECLSEQRVECLREEAVSVVHGDIGGVELAQARVEAHIQRAMGLPAMVLLADRQGRLGPHAATDIGLDPDELAVAQWALESGAPAGRGTPVLPGARGLFLPLVGTEGPVGVLALFQDPAGAARGAQGLTLALAAQISLGLERARLAEERAEARLRADHEQLRSTLLSSVSHDLRTPLGTITGATTSLLDPGPEAAPGDQRMLLQTIHQESCRLERLVNNLLELTKLESGQVQVRKEWVPMEEVVGAAVGRLEEQLGDR